MGYGVWLELNSTPKMGFPVWLGMPLAAPSHSRHFSLSVIRSAVVVHRPATTGAGYSSSLSGSLSLLSDSHSTMHAQKPEIKSLISAAFFSLLSLFPFLRQQRAVSAEFAAASSPRHHPRYFSPILPSFFAVSCLNSSNRRRRPFHAAAVATGGQSAPSLRPRRLDPSSLSLSPSSRRRCQSTSPRTQS